MTSFPGGMPSEFRRSPPSPSLSSLSPLAAPFTAGGRPFPSDPIHNPASLGPTAPSMFHSSQHPMNIPADAFTFASGSDGISAAATSYYRPYEHWKPSWVPEVSADGSDSWIDPSQTYPFSPMDKVSMALKDFERNQIPPSAPHANPLPNTYHIVPEASPWKWDQDPSLYSTGSLLSKGSRLSGMDPTLKEPSLDPFPNASRSSVAGHADPFSNGFRSSVMAPMLKELSDSFSLDTSSSKGYCGLPYDKYMTQLESCSAQSLTNPPPLGPGSGLGVVPTDPLVNCTSGFTSVHYGNPCRISLEYFDSLPHEQKDPIAHSNTNRTKVTIAAPVTKSPAIKGDNQVVRPHKLEVRCRPGNAEPGNPGTGFDLDSSVDEHNVVLDSPCWKGVPSSSEHTFSKRHTGNSCSFPFENEISSGNLLPSETSQDKKLDSVTIGLVNSSEEEAKDVKTNQNFHPENVQENISSYNNMKDEKSKGLASAILPDIVGPQTDVMLLIKSMHDISQVLLTSCGDDFEIKEVESELLQMAMENLKSFIGRSNKTDDGGLASSFKIAEQITAGMNKMTSSNEAGDNQINVGPQLADTNYKNYVLEGLDKIPGEDSEVEAELYKNLWIEAEASLCTMKYELQLARTKLKMMSHKHAQEANSSSSLCDPQPSSSMQKVGATTLPKQTSGDLNNDMTEEKNTEGPVADPDVMARLRIIKGRMGNMESQDQNNAEKSLEENITEQNKDHSYVASSGDEVLHDEVDSDVMARLRILERRGDIGLNAESVFPNFYSLGFATEPRDLHPRVGSSEWEHVLRDELNPSGNNPMNG
ncbi:uncharacterized protein LOC144551404 isoform X4 [Carex rostrata]